MVNRGWTVTTVDIDPLVSPDYVRDVRGFNWSGPKIDLLWASPPCQEFTRLALPFRQWKHYDTEPDLSVVYAVRRLISEIQPRFWIVENVMSSRKYLTPIFGRVLAVVGGHVLWGNVPLLVGDVPAHKTCMGPLKGSGWSRGQVRSLIPIELSWAVAEAVERAG